MLTLKIALYFDDDSEGIVIRYSIRILRQKIEHNDYLDGTAQSKVKYGTKRELNWLSEPVLAEIRWVSSQDTIVERLRLRYEHELLLRMQYAADRQWGMLKYEIQFPD